VSQSDRHELFLRILHGVRYGFQFANKFPEAAQPLAERTEGMTLEHHYLSKCLYLWRRTEWNPVGAAFLDFASAFYPWGTLYHRLMFDQFAEVLPFARVFEDRWRLGLWAEMGWSRGQAFPRNRPNYCRDVLKSIAPETLQDWHQLYEDCVIRPAGPSSEIHIEKATLHFFGTHAESDLARSYCTGHEPRRLARAAFDFAFWMGVFAKVGVPSPAERSVA
jgi:hypothetical protein